MKPLWTEPPAADTSFVMLWTFGKGKARISLGRQPESNVLVVVRGRDQVREYRFTDASKLRVFQTDMEGFLRKTGWTLLEFHPERRRGGNRGRSPRPQERRRWWTDEGDDDDQPADSDAIARSKG